jgi:hypothetical protein
MRWLGWCGGPTAGKIVAHIGFTPELEHKIIAGADILVHETLPFPLPLPLPLSLALASLVAEAVGELARALTLDLALADT